MKQCLSVRYGLSKSDIEAFARAFKGALSPSDTEASLNSH